MGHKAESFNKPDKQKIKLNYTIEFDSRAFDDRICNEQEVKVEPLHLII